MLSNKQLQNNLNLLKKHIETTEGELILDDSHIILNFEELEHVVFLCSAVLGHFNVDLDTREILGG